MLMMMMTYKAQSQVAKINLTFFCCYMQAVVYHGKGDTLWRVRIVCKNCTLKWGRVRECAKIHILFQSLYQPIF